MPSLSARRRWVILLIEIQLLWNYFAEQSIISISQKEIIEKWAGKQMDELLWRASEHDFQVSTFHTHCDHKVVY